MYPANAPPFIGGYIKVLSIVSISVFYEWKVVYWKTLVLNKEAISSGGLQRTDLNMSLNLADSDGYILWYCHLLMVAFIDNNLILWSI